MFIWIRWTCKICGETHVGRFDVKPYHIIPYQIKKYAWHKDDEHFPIWICDIAWHRKRRPRKRGSSQRGCSEIYAKLKTPTWRIMKVLRAFIEEMSLYAVKDGTLTLEVCMA